MHQTVAAVFENPIAARYSLEAVGAAGFKAEQIGMMLSEPQHRAHIVNLPEGKAVEGVAAGGVVGAVLGGLTALGSLAIPGVGLVMVSGTILAALAGMGGGAAAGGVVGGLIGLGIPKKQARVFAEEIEKGKTVLTVSATDSESIQRAENLLSRFLPSRQITYAAPTVAAALAEAEEAHSA